MSPSPTARVGNGSSSNRTGADRRQHNGRRMKAQGSMRRYRTFPAGVVNSCKNHVVPVCPVCDKKWIKTKRRQSLKTQSAPPSRSKGTILNLRIKTTKGGATTFRKTHGAPCYFSLPPAGAKPIQSTAAKITTRCTLMRSLLLPLMLPHPLPLPRPLLPPVLSPLRHPRHP